MSSEVESAEESASAAKRGAKLLSFGKEVARVLTKHTARIRTVVPSVLMFLWALLKVYLGLIVILVLAGASTGLLNRWARLAIDLDQAFDVKNIEHSAPTNGIMNSIRINGVDGGSLVLSAFATKHDQAVPVEPSEVLLATPKTLDQIKSSLDQLDLEKWVQVSKLPPSIFRFDLSLKSEPTSPNNLKKISYFLIYSGTVRTNKVMPGQEIVFARNISISRLSEVLSNTKVGFFYHRDMPNFFTTMTAYDPSGKFISQSTGTIKLRLHWITIITIFLGAWAFWIGLLVLIKQTLVIGKQLKEANSKLWPQSESHSKSIDD